jgi:hypothetical protein
MYLNSFTLQRINSDHLIFKQTGWWLVIPLLSKGLGRGTSGLDADNHWVETVKYISDLTFGNIIYLKTMFMKEYCGIINLRSLGLPNIVEL